MRKKTSKSQKNVKNKNKIKTSEKNDLRFVRFNLIKRLAYFPLEEILISITAPKSVSS